METINYTDGVNQVIKNIIAENMKRLRKEKDLSQKRLSELSGVSIPFVKGLESARQNPSIETLDKIASALGVEIVTLLTVHQPKE